MDAFLLSQAPPKPKRHVEPKFKRKDARGLGEAVKYLGEGYTYISFSSSSSIRDKGAIFLAESFFQDKLTSLLKLTLDSQHITDKGASQIFASLEYNKTLEKIEVQRNSFGSKSMKVLAKSLAVNRTLKWLDLGNNNLGDSSVVELLPGLIANEGIEFLGLSNTRMTHVAGIKLALEVLPVNTALKKLNLDKNSLMKGAQAFADALSKNPPLNHLDMSRCKLKDDGIKSLINGLMSNEKLEWIDLHKNGITEEGAGAIASLLEANSSITSLDLSSNNLGHGIESILRSLETNTTMTALFVDHLTFSQDNRMHEFLRRNLDLKIEKEFETFREIMKDGKAMGRLMHSKLMVVGPGSVGKTATVRSLLSKSFEKEWVSTVGASLLQAQAFPSGGWSTEEGERSLTTEFAARAAFKKLQENKSKVDLRQQKNLKQKNPTNIMPPPPLPGISEDSNNDDFKETSEKDMDEEIAKRFDEALITEAGYNEESITFSIYDYGGQTVFHNFHHLFLTKYGIYLLVFDMRKMLDDKDSHSGLIKFWMNSVKLHAPESPILLVGTYMDVIKSRESIEKVEQAIQVTAPLWPKRIIENEEEQLSFYPISNSLSLGVHKLRIRIEEIVRKEDYIKREVPLRWIQCIHEITEQKKPYIPLSEARQIARKWNINSEYELSQLLILFHEYGQLLYFTATKNLSQIVTVNPQWLINAISKVIRDGRIHGYNTTNIEKKGLNLDMKEMLENGYASRELLKYLWKDSGKFQFLLDFMKETLLLCDLPLLNIPHIESRTAWYLIPSMLTRCKPSDENGASEECILRFPILPLGLFERLVTLCIVYSNQNSSHETAPKLYANAACIELHQTCKVEFMLYIERNEITFKFDKEEHAGRLLAVVFSMLRKIKVDIMGDGFFWEVFFESGESILSFEEARNKNLKPYFSDQHLESKSVSNLNVEEFIASVSN